MNLFDPIVETEKLHKNFRSICLPNRAPEREELLRWVAGFPDRDGKFIREFQSTFNSSFWEIYLFAAFKEFGFQFDWSYPSPDFNLTREGASFVVEAGTANAAEGKPNEWDRLFTPEELRELSLGELNREAIIRLASTAISKSRHYEKSYSKMDHVRSKPFMLAIAPFEQPHFNLQYDRPIRALLYDNYVDEDAFLRNPKRYPNGPPSRSLGYVEKDNGAEIPLGMFNDDQYSEISAVLFSCTATWGKVGALTREPLVDGVINSIWAIPPNGAVERRALSRRDHVESITDGIQVYHNPFSTYPIPETMFRREGVVQVFPDPTSRQLRVEGSTNCLLHRQVFVASPDFRDTLETAKS